MKKKFLLMVVSTEPHECFVGDTTEAETMKEAIKALVPIDAGKLFTDQGYYRINNTNFYQIVQIS